MKFARPRLPAFDKHLILFVVAILLGLMAAWAARHYLTERAADIEARGKGEQARLVVARVDLAAGTPLTVEHLASREIPLAWAQSGAVRPEHVDRVEGSVLAHPIKAGEMLLWAQLEGRKAPTFSARIEVGRRAVTVPVDEISSISGLLEPGDQIDLVVTVDQGGTRRSVPVLSHVRVMATGQRAESDDRSGDRRLYTTVTLDLAPQEADNLILARESGRLTALLRHPDDSRPLAGVPERFIDWLAPRSAAAAVAAPARPHGIPVHYGGRGSTPVADPLRLPDSPTVASGGSAASAPIVASSAVATPRTQP